MLHLDRAGARQAWLVSSPGRLPTDGVTLRRGGAKRKFQISSNRSSGKVKARPDAISLKQLRAFREVVERGSLTAAADALSLSVPAVHAQLRSLRSFAGADVLDRGSDGAWSPTAEGEVMPRRRPCRPDRGRPRDRAARLASRRASPAASSSASSVDGQVLRPVPRRPPRPGVSRRRDRAPRRQPRRDHRRARRGPARPRDDGPPAARAGGRGDDARPPSARHRRRTRPSARRDHARRSGGALARDLPRPRGRLGHAHPDDALPRPHRRGPPGADDRDGHERDDQAGGDGRARHRPHLAGTR